MGASTFDTLARRVAGIVSRRAVFAATGAALSAALLPLRTPAKKGHKKKGNKRCKGLARVCYATVTGFCLQYLEYEDSRMYDLCVQENAYCCGFYLHCREAQGDACLRGLGPPCCANASDICCGASSPAACCPASHPVCPGPGDPALCCQADKPQLCADGSRCCREDQRCCPNGCCAGGEDCCPTGCCPQGST
jgi:hypothetical protein